MSDGARISWHERNRKSAALMGQHEAQQALGISRQRLHALRHGRNRNGASVPPDPRFPVPVAELRCGPVWRAADVLAYAKTRNERT